MACSYGLLSVNHGLLWGIVAYYFGLLGVPGRNLIQEPLDLCAGCLAGMQNQGFLKQFPTLRSRRNMEEMRFAESGPSDLPNRQTISRLQVLPAGPKSLEARYLLGFGECHYGL